MLLSEETPEEQKEERPEERAEECREQEPQEESPECAQGCPFWPFLCCGVFTFLCMISGVNTDFFFALARPTFAFSFLDKNDSWCHFHILGYFSSSCVVRALV